MVLFGRPKLRQEKIILGQTFLLSQKTFLVKNSCANNISVMLRVLIYGQQLRFYKKSGHPGVVKKRN